jgi:hypothetical protein
VAMNKSVTKYAPKDRMYCGTMSLSSRTHAAAGIDSVGCMQYWTRVFVGKLGFPQLPVLTRMNLEKMDKRKDWIRVHQRKTSTKRKRATMKTEKMRIETERDI